jgi:hypothetical protein
MQQKMDGNSLQARSASEGKTFPLRWRFGLVKNYHSFRRLPLLLALYIEKRNFKNSQ